MLGDVAGEFGTTEDLAFGPLSCLVSQACFHSMLKARFNDSLYISLTDKIRGLTSAPILNVPKPCPPETALEEEPLRYKPQLKEPAFLERLFALSQRTAEAVSAAHGAEVVWPPADVWARPGYTKPEFGRGALTMGRIRRSEQGPDEDGRHMNEDYGSRVLKEILTKLDRVSGGQVFERKPLELLRPAAE